MWCSGSCWTKSCGKSLTALRTKDSLKKNSISPSGSITPNTGGQGRADERPPKLPAAQPRPKRPQDNLGSCWPEAIKEVYQNGLCTSTKRPYQGQNKSSVKSDKTAADFLFTCRSSGNSVLSVHEKTNRFQYRSHPDGNDHASIFLHGNV